MASSRPPPAAAGQWRGRPGLEDPEEHTTAEPTRARAGAAAAPGKIGPPAETQGFEPNNTFTVAEDVGDGGADLLARGARAQAQQRARIAGGTDGPGRLATTPAPDARPRVAAGVLGAGDEPDDAFFAVAAGSDLGKRFALARGRISIGRGIDNDIVLSDIAVSRRHLVVEHDGHGFVLTDLGSGNGTLINGRDEDGTYRMVDGDRLELGNTVLVFECPQMSSMAAMAHGAAPRNWGRGEGDELATVAGRPQPRGPERAEPYREPRDGREPREPAVIAPPVPAFLEPPAQDFRSAEPTYLPIEPPAYREPPREARGNYREPTDDELGAHGPGGYREEPAYLPEPQPLPDPARNAYREPQPLPEPARNAYREPPPQPRATQRGPAMVPPARPAAPRPVVPPAPVYPSSVRVDTTEPPAYGYAAAAGGYVSSSGSTGSVPPLAAYSPHAAQAQAPQPYREPSSYGQQPPTYPPSGATPYSQPPTAAPAFVYPSGNGAGGGTAVPATSQRRKTGVWIGAGAVAATAIGIALALVTHKSKPARSAVTVAASSAGTASTAAGGTASAATAATLPPPPAAGSAPRATATTPTPPSVAAQEITMASLVTGTRQLPSTAFGTDESWLHEPAAALGTPPAAATPDPDPVVAPIEPAREIVRSGDRDPAEPSRTEPRRTEPRREPRGASDDDDDTGDDDEAGASADEAIDEASDLYGDEKYAEAAALLRKAARSAGKKDAAKLSRIATGYAKVADALDEARDGDPVSRLRAYKDALRADAQWGDGEHQDSIGSRLAQVAVKAAGSHMAGGRFAEARAACDDADKYGAKDPAITRIRSSLENKAQQLADDAEAAEADGDDDRAEELAAQVKKMVPRSSSAWSKADAIK